MWHAWLWAKMWVDPPLPTQYPSDISGLNQSAVCLCSTDPDTHVLTLENCQSINLFSVHWSLCILRENHKENQDCTYHVNSSSGLTLIFFPPPSTFLVTSNLCQRKATFETKRSWAFLLLHLWHKWHGSPHSVTAGSPHPWPQLYSWASPLSSTPFWSCIILCCRLFLLFDGVCRPAPK